MITKFMKVIGTCNSDYDVLDVLIAVVSQLLKKTRHFYQTKTLAYNNENLYLIMRSFVCGSNGLGPNKPRSNIISESFHKKFSQIDLTVQENEEGI